MGREQKAEEAGGGGKKGTRSHRAIRFSLARTGTLVSQTNFITELKILMIVLKSFMSATILPLLTFPFCLEHCCTTHHNLFLKGKN